MNKTKQKRKPASTGRGGVTYPWEKWLNQMCRRKVTLRKGKHYDCMTHSMQMLVKQNARRRGYSISTRIVDGGVECHGSKITVTPRRKARGQKEA